MKRDCDNCHKGRISDPVCWYTCMYTSEHPHWEPETNGDKVRKMTDEELRDLWAVNGFDKKYWDECMVWGGECEYYDFTCESCPKTFYNWLSDVAEEKDVPPDKITLADAFLQDIKSDPTRQVEVTMTYTDLEIIKRLILAERERKKNGNKI